MAVRNSLPFALLLTAACGGAQQTPIETGRAEPAAVDEGLSSSNLSSVVAVVPVKDHAAATAWYRAWIGRDPDVVPMAGIAEWQLAGTGWIQIGLDAEHAGHTTVVVGIKDLEAQRKRFTDAGLTLGEVQDHGFIALAEAVDPDGNKVVFVQEKGGSVASGVGW